MNSLQESWEDYVNGHRSRRAMREHFRDLLGSRWKWDDPTAVYGDTTHPLLKIGPVATVTKLYSQSIAWLSDGQGNTIEVDQAMLPRIATRIL